MNQHPARQSSPLNDADRALIARDTDLPGLGLLLDEEALLDEVGRQMPAADVACIRIDYLRYKPGTSCMAGLRVIDTLGRTQHAFARALTASNPDWDQHAARLQKRAALDGRFSAHVLPRTRLLLASAVHDRRITALGTLLNTPGTLDGTQPLPTTWASNSTCTNAKSRLTCCATSPSGAWCCSCGRVRARWACCAPAPNGNSPPPRPVPGWPAPFRERPPWPWGPPGIFWSCPGSAARAWTCWATTPRAPCRSCLRTGKCHRPTCPSWTWASSPTLACAWGSCTRPASRTPCTVPWPMTSMP